MRNAQRDLTLVNGGRVDLCLLGGPTISVDGVPTELTPLQQALLTLVFGHGTAGVSRARVGWLLWEEDDTPRLRQRIRQLLHRSRERVGQGVIVRNGDRLRPGSVGIRSDLDYLEGLLRGGRLAEAAGLVSKGLSTKIAGPHSREFDDWRIGKEVWLVGRVKQAAARRWDETSEAGLWGEARDAAEALYILSPDDLSAVTRVVEARARTGSVASAEAIFEHLHIKEPAERKLSDLRALIDRASNLRLNPKETLGATETKASVVGREEEIASVVSALSDVSDGWFRFVLISGEGGIGKTRVLEEVEREAVLSGFRCLYARPTEAEQRIPLNPLADALAGADLARHLRALGTPWRSVIASLLPVDDAEPIAEVPPIREARLSRRLMDALFLLLERIGCDEPTILLLDDLHWADTTTITALQFIQRRWTRGSLGVIAAVRPECIDQSSPATDYINSQHDLPVTRISLSELSNEDARRLVDEVLGPGVDGHIRERICELGNGHPLYVTELCRDYLAGRLQISDAVLGQVTVPVSLQEIFRRRLTLLSSTSIKVAGLLAVRGRPMRLTEIADLTGLPLTKCADCAEELDAIRLVDLSDDRLKVSHELFRSALYQHLSDARRAVLHRSVAEYLASTGHDVTEAELAIHYDRAGEAERAVGHGWAAAERAVASGAVAEAAYFYDLVMRNERDPAEQAVATSRLARALHLGRSIERANPVLSLAASRLRQTGDFNEALRMDIRQVDGLAEADSAPIPRLLRRLALIKRESRRLADWEALALALDAELRLRHTMGDLASISPIFESMREVVRRGTRAARALSHAGLAVQILFGNDPPAALSHGRWAVRECDPASEHRLRVLLRLLLVLQYGGRFYGSEAGQIVDEARALAKTSGDLLLRFSLESNIAVAHLDSGNLDAAEVAMERSTAMLGSAELDMNRFNQAINEGELALARGDFERARRSFETARGLAGPKTPAYSESVVIAGLGLCSLETGDLRKARALEDSLPGDPNWWYFDPTLLIMFRSRMHAYRGERNRATALLTEVATALEDRLVLAWLKLNLFHAQLERRTDTNKAIELASRGLVVSEQLGLEDRVRQFSNLLRGLRSAKS